MSGEWLVPTSRTRISICAQSKMGYHRGDRITTRAVITGTATTAETSAARASALRRAAGCTAAVRVAVLGPDGFDGPRLLAPSGFAPDRLAPAFFTPGPARFCAIVTNSPIRRLAAQAGRTSLA